MDCSSGPEYPEVGSRIGLRILPPTDRAARLTGDGTEPYSGNRRMIGGTQNGVRVTVVVRDSVGDPVVAATPK